VSSRRQDSGFANPAVEQLKIFGYSVPGRIAARRSAVFVITRSSGPASAASCAGSMETSESGTYT
jgi:hypothetical protein